jgi:hypothetical protein
MKLRLFELAIVVSLLVLGCESNKKVPSTDALVSAGGSVEPFAQVDSPPPATEDGNKVAGTCRLVSFAFPMETGPPGKRVVIKKTMVFEYEANGQVVTATTGVEGEIEKEGTVYQYDGKGRLAQVEIAKAASNRFQGVKAVYEYGPEGRLQKIVGSGALATRSFAYGADGRILHQTTEFGPQGAGVFGYSYDGKGAPNAVNVMGPDGKIMTNFTFEYDTKHNPFADKGLASISGLLFGHPVGAYKHNIIRHETRNPEGSGQVQVRKMAYTYNELGYPLTLTQNQGGADRVSRFRYQCD